MAPYSLRNEKFTCEEWQKINGQCPITTGQQVLELYKLDKDPEMYLMALGVCAVVYRFAAYIVLKMAKERWFGRLWKKVGGGKKSASVVQTAQA